jgi:hypothetical protein
MAIFGTRIPEVAEATSPAPAWTVQAVQALGVTCDVETAGAILGIGRTKAYELAKRGEFPTKIIRVGRRYVVPTPALLNLLGASDAA